MCVASDRWLLTQLRGGTTSPPTPLAIERWGGGRCLEDNTSGAGALPLAMYLRVWPTVHAAIEIESTVFAKGETVLRGLRGHYRGGGRSGKIKALTARAVLTG